MLTRICFLKNGQLVGVCNAFEVVLYFFQQRSKIDSENKLGVDTKMAFAVDS